MYVAQLPKSFTKYIIENRILCMGRLIFEHPWTTSIGHTWDFMHG
jgi:hypothetical protein